MIPKDRLHPPASVDPHASVVQPICKVGGKWIYELPVSATGWQLPNGATDLCIWSSEAGGGRAMTARIITIPTGAPLRPLGTLPMGWLEHYKEHARFVSAGSLVTVSVHWQENTPQIDIKEYSVKRVIDGLVTIGMKEIDHGTPEEISQRQAQYAEAVRHAVRKSLCQNCNGAHYVVAWAKERCQTLRLDYKPRGPRRSGPRRRGP